MNVEHSPKILAREEKATTIAGKSGKDDILDEILNHEPRLCGFSMRTLTAENH